MTTKPVTYSLEIHQLHAPYSTQKSLERSTRLHMHEAEQPFGAFHVGETITDGPSLTYLGRIQHIHHWVGDTGDEIRHGIALYLLAED